jgi:hypothetical protein
LFVCPTVLDKAEQIAPSSWPFMVRSTQHQLFAPEIELGPARVALRDYQRRPSPISAVHLAAAAD